jgi:hypothetical protein
VVVSSAALSLGLAGTAAAATIEVDTAADENTDPGPETGCSLREATTAANIDDPYGGCVEGTGDDAITFAPAVVSAGTIDLTTVGGPLLIDEIDDDRLDILGPGFDQLEITNSNSTDQIFSILDVDETVEISNLTISGGDRDGTAIFPGAGIFNEANLTLTGVEISGNHVATVGDSGLGDTTSAEGGGIWSGGPLTIDSSLIESNTVNASNSDDDVNNVFARGAGIYFASGSPLTVTNSFIASNAADADDNSTDGVSATEAVGGGIFADDAVTIEQATLDANSVTADSDLGAAQAKGGAVRLNGASSRVELSTVTANRAVADAGDQIRGAGVLVVGSTMELTSSTIAENGALAVDTDGANLYAEGSGGATVTNTIIASPVGLTLAGTSNCFEDTADNIVSNGFNLDFDPDALTSSCNFTETSDVFGEDPILGDLADNGGIGETMLPEPTSPVIDQGSADAQDIDDEDQRGLDRPAFFADTSNAPLGDGADIGAVEVQIAPPTFTATTPASPNVVDTPNVLGAVSLADSVDPLIVRLFTDPNCAVPSGTPADPGTFASPGIEASPPVPHNNVITTFHGTVETDYGVSHCSTGPFPNTIGYQNTLIDPTPPVVTPPPVTTTPAPTKKKKCKKGFVRKKGKCVKKKRKKKR